jgi:hypothetical protein
MHVKIAAENASEADLRALVEEASRCAPIGNAVVYATPLAMQTEVGGP